MSDIEVREFDGSPEQWDQWVAEAPGALFCHQYEWLQLVRDVYGGDPCYLAAYRGDDIVGVLPIMLRRIIGEGRVLISVPLSDEAGIVAKDAETERSLWDHACRLADSMHATRLELRQRRLLPGAEADLSRVNMEQVLPDDPEVLWESFPAKVRNQVRKAQKMGLTASASPDLHAAIHDDFYPVYCENTRDLGSPMHSERFFHAVADLAPESSQVVVVKSDEATVGAAFATRWRDRFAVPWASSLRQYFKMCPNNLLYWELMRQAISAGCSVFDFGRSPNGSGTYRFKRQWGAEPAQLYYYHYGRSGAPGTGSTHEGLAYRLFVSIWPKMPLPIARVLGPRIFARLPI